MTRRWRHAPFVGGAIVVAPCVFLGALAALTPIPTALDDAGTAPERTDRNSVEITDRTGVVLAEVRDEEGMRQRRLPLSELGEPVQKAIIAAEDSRFYAHPGVDPIAVARAAVTSLLEGRVVSGASTLTQQLARTLTGAPRSVRGKVDVMALAIRLEATLTKDRILEAYLNHVEFGPNVRGVEAAAQTYFGKPAKALSLAEAAALASIPRGPSVYDPQKHIERLRTRRDRVLDRMAKHGLAPADAVERAKGEPLVVDGRSRVGSAPHFVAALRAGALDPCARSPALPEGTVSVKTTLVADLQREIEQAARATVRELEGKSVTAASVVVLENETGDILAYVGSPDAGDEARLGGNDGCRAKRQPGSTLKPFVYERAIAELGMTPATMLPDVELSFLTPEGDAFRPKNYDERFHGPVLIRQALGNSFNVPAVWLTERLGTSSVVEQLRAVGFCSLDQAPSHYGVGIALGDGEVTLLELASAYATLARGGTTVRPNGVLEIAQGDGSVERPSRSSPARVLDENAAAFITDILRDPRARMASFGEATVFDLPFEIAAKTGTSKGFRDNWAVGYTPEITVAVWVGNFDGSPMKDVSGIAGAGPLFRRSMIAASQLVVPSSFEPPDGTVVDICPLSGKRAGTSCPHRKKERVPADAELGTCDMHVSVRIDRATGHRAGPACDTDIEHRVYEQYPPLLTDWARASNRGVAPEAYAARCPGPEEPSQKELRILYPEDGAAFYVSDGATAHIRARATFSSDAASSRFVLDGKPIALDASGAALIALAPGTHSLVARSGERDSEPVTFTVE